MSCEWEEPTLVSTSGIFICAYSEHCAVALLDNVRVRIEHSHFSLKDLAQVTVRDPQTLLVTVHDADVSVLSQVTGDWVIDQVVL